MRRPPDDVLTQIIRAHEKKGLKFDGTETADSTVILPELADCGYEPTDEEYDSGYWAEQTAEGCVQLYIRLREEGEPENEAKQLALGSYRRVPIRRRATSL